MAGEGENRATVQFDRRVNVDRVNGKRGTYVERGNEEGREWVERFHWGRQSWEKNLGEKTWRRTPMK